ncbi:MAG: RNA-binding S4 domain-containing protein [Rhizobacter sp.]|nr:RNA-binding S4 domain-containing protein [Rhizobacter sp.]MBP6270326.1 RNA-binding S4 domain-containing protein [Rhizobacter sp.]
MEWIDFELRGEYIALDALLKATGMSDSGGAAKALVASGRVQVDGRDELRKTCKIRAGQVVAVAGSRIRVAAATATVPIELPGQDDATPAPDR